MAYCETTDLLLGDMTLSESVDPQAFVDNASDEIDSKIGYLYVVPIQQTAVPNFIWTKLKNINAKLATARLILAVNVGGEEDAMHAYGVGLLSEAKAELECIKSGSDPLIGATPVGTSGGDGNGNAPTLLQTDRVSGVDAFYDYVNEPPWAPCPPPGVGPRWQPGRRGGFGPFGPTTPQPARKDPR